jgi:hypothetical protein
MIPQKIENDFQEHHMSLAWQELKTRFGFNLTAWRMQFREEFLRQPRNVTEVEFFLIFGNRSTNDLLNQILGRRRLHPTFNKMIEYILNNHESGKVSSGYSKRR